MHEIASYIISFFLSPFNWIVIFILAGFLLRGNRTRKICRVVALCIFLFFSSPLLLECYAKWWQPAPVTISKNASYSCGIVPGGFASPDALGNGYFNATADRFIQVEKLYKQGNISHILISGGNGKVNDASFREGAWVKDELIAMGIPDSVIFTEDRSNNTADNAAFAKQILDSLQLKPPYLLITSAQHIPRASLLFRNAGVLTKPFPCNYIAGRSSFGFSSLIPQPSVLLTWDFYLKETLAYLIYKVKG